MIESSLAASTEPLVEAIIRRKLCEPAIFILEMCKPLVGCMRELYGIGEPLASALLGPKFAPALRAALASSEAVEDIIQRLESSRDGNRSLSVDTAILFGVFPVSMRLRGRLGAVQSRGAR